MGVFNCLVHMKNKNSAIQFLIANCSAEFIPPYIAVPFYAVHLLFETLLPSDYLRIHVLRQFRLLFSSYLSKD